MASAELQIPEHIQETQNITREELEMILHTQNPLVTEELRRRAQQTAKAIYENKIYVRGLIEFTNYCKNNCYYCGIRCSNTDADRYRLSLEQILSCCETGWNLGFRTFVLQGGEDPHFTDEHICQIVRTIKEIYPDCAVTLSIGEKSEESYQAYFDAGADRYLLRHETADEDHYRKLHPEQMSLVFRKNCLKTLKKIGYQTGCGFMVGSPGQTADTLYSDLLFIKELKPEMIGIGPFIPHHDTCFRDCQAGTLEDTLFLLSLIRLIHPRVLLPATTALGTIVADGREQGILAGANVVMPNISPTDMRKNYLLYDNKIGTQDDAAESQRRLEESIAAIGYQVVSDRGDYCWEDKV